MHRFIYPAGSQNRKRNPLILQGPTYIYSFRCIYRVTMIVGQEIATSVHFSSLERNSTR